MVLELGAGKGRAKEYLNVPSTELVQLDSSDEMFALKDREECVLKIVADACNIPLAPSQFSLVVGFLADPFFGLDCLNESYRMLCRGGSVFFTLPAYAWATRLRELINVDVMTTRFKKLKTDEVVVLPSLVHNPDKIREMLLLSSFKNIEVHEHTLPKGHQPVSQDIVTPAEAMGIDVYELPVITTVRADR
jgi:SAM-dependent methyltransferase